MKTNKNITILKCDQCGKEDSDNGDLYIGGNVFHRWITIKLYNSTSQLQNINIQQDYDFCSWECLIKFSKNKIKSF